MRLRKILAALLLAPLVLAGLAAIGIALFGWNWARAPLQHAVLARTGRALEIAGDLDIRLGWPALHLQARGVSFANPAWAAEPRMLAVEVADIAIDLPALWQRRLVLSTAHLTQPVVMLEVSPEGRKTWLLDGDQSDENARVRIGRLSLDHGQLGFDDARHATHIRMQLDTPDASTGRLVFSAEGRYKGLALHASGQGGPVLTLRDESLPYALDLEATIGRTGLRASGHIVGLLSLAAVDLQLALHGDNLADLFPLLGVGLPRTRDYVTAGHLVRSGSSWRYDNFTGRVGRSDVAGSLQIEQAGVRPLLRGAVSSQVLDVADLGPAVGADVPAPQAAAPSPRAATQRVLPELPFDTRHWRAFDVDVMLHAQRIKRANTLPLQAVVVRARMQDAVLSFDPLEFAVAGGRLVASIRLDARQGTIQASAKARARQVLLGQLLPTLVLARSDLGQANGELDLAGRGNSVGAMLASANGSLRLVVARGEISRLLVERMGLHLLEILQLSITGDQSIAVNCAVADFSLEHGIMSADTLLLETDISSLSGSGQIDLGQETLDLRLVPRTRATSLVALRGPIHVGGTLGAPVVTLDKTRILTRAAGALALGLVNPLLALLPLVEAGPGPDSACGRLLAAPAPARVR